MWSSSAAFSPGCCRSLRNKSCRSPLPQTCRFQARAQRSAGALLDGTFLAGGGPVWPGTNAKPATKNKIRRLKNPRCLPISRHSHSYAPWTAAIYPACVTDPGSCGPPILKSHPLGVSQHRQQESHRKVENPGRQFPFLNLGEPMPEPRPVPAVATGWRRNKKYSIRNAIAVQYCSLLDK